MVLLLAGFYFPAGGWGEWLRGWWEQREERALYATIARLMAALPQQAAAFAEEGPEGAAAARWMEWGAMHECFIFGFSEGHLFFWNTHQYPAISTVTGVPLLEDSSFGRYIVLPAVVRNDTTFIAVIPLTKTIASVGQQRAMEYPMSRWGKGQWECTSPAPLDDRTTLRACFSLPQLPPWLEAILGVLYGGCWVVAVLWIVMSFAVPWRWGLLALVASLGWYLPPPPSLQRAGFFSPHVFALAPWFDSFFDLIAGITVVLALWHLVVDRFAGMRGRGVRWVLGGMGVLAGAGMMHMLVHLVVANSALSFHFSYFPTLTLHHFFLLGGLGLLFVGWGLGVDRLMPKAMWRTPRGRWLVALSAGLLVALVVGANFSPGWARSAGWLMWAVALMASVGMFFLAPRFRLPRWLMRLMPFALLIGTLFPLYQQEKEKAQLPVVARKLVEERNIDEEYLLTKAAAAIRDDPLIRWRLRDDSLRRREIVARLQNLYLRQFAGRYDIHVVVGAANQSFPEAVHAFLQQARPVEPSGRVRAFRSRDARTHYFLVIPYEHPRTELIIWLRPVSLFEESPYFELTRRPLLRLLDRFRIRDYAIYYQGELVRTYGDYPYPRRLDVMLDRREGNDYEHFVIKAGAENVVVLSRPHDSLWIRAGNYTIPILLLLIWWAVVWGLFLLARRDLRRLFPGTFRGRLQLALVLIILFMPVTTMFWAPTYLRVSFEDTERSRILTTLRKIYQYMQSSPPPVAPALSNIEDAQAWFYQLGYLLRTDIHLFDYEGHLLVTTRPFLFESHILSPLMNPHALRTFRTKLPVHLVLHETIGPLTYLSAYLPIVQTGQTILSYLNISRYVNTADYEDSLNQLVMLLTNISVALLLVMLFVSIFLAQHLSRPLLLLRQRMASFQLGQNQEPIRWPHDDEFKILVATYNRLLKALQASAEALRRAERERTWREIAQQVAHEIKNPLTPMKLRIEQLRMRYDPQNPRWQRYFQDTMKMLLNQIDLLDRIASEFSEYARMPQGIPARISAHQYLRQVLTTFQDTSHVRILTDFRARPDTIRIDPHHFQQIIINLVKNAIQAIPEDAPDGRVVIRTSNEGQYVTIAVEDNGPGIPPRIRDQIFKIRFSTKRKGRGWGLPLIERLVTQAGGRIVFITEEGRGTTFYIRFPRA